MSYQLILLALFFVGGNERWQVGNLRISFSLEDEGIIADARPLGIEEISTGIKMDQVEHVEECPADTDDERRWCHHVETIKELPKW